MFHTKNAKKLTTNSLIFNSSNLEAKVFVSKQSANFNRLKMIPIHSKYSQKSETAGLTAWIKRHGMRQNTGTRLKK